MPEISFPVSLSLGPKEVWRCQRKGLDMCSWESLHKGPRMQVTYLSWHMSHAVSQKIIIVVSIVIILMILY